MRRLALVLTLLLAPVTARAADPFTFLLPLFERYLESLRQQAGIPGLSAAIVQNGQIIWEAGFGFQDIENSIRATPDTPYPVSDLTQTFTSTLLLQCLEHGTLTLDQPVAVFTPMIPEPGASVEHVLSHRSAAIPGEAFKYDPARFAAALTPATTACIGVAQRGVLARLLDRLAMRDSVPGLDLEDPATAPPGMFDEPTLNRYAAVLQRVARPYRLDKSGKPVRSAYTDKGVNAATGLISTVRDLARYDAAFYDDVFLQPETLALAWTNAVSPKTGVLPSGLGWFVQFYKGERVIWHFGLLANSSSSLILKVPGRGLTLILLANSDGLSAPFQLSAGDVTTSLFARLFLRIFV